MNLNAPQSSAYKREGAMILYSPKVLALMLLILGGGLSPTRAQQVSPQQVGNGPVDSGVQSVPQQTQTPAGAYGEPTSTANSQSGNSQDQNAQNQNGQNQQNPNSQDQSNQKNPNGSNTPLNPNAQNTWNGLYQGGNNPQNPPGTTNYLPIIPQQTTSPYAPLSGTPPGDNQPSMYSSPILSNTGAFDLSNIATNNALMQAFYGPAAAGFATPDEGVSYSNPPIDRIQLGPIDMRAALAFTVINDDNLTAGQGGTQKLSDTYFTVTPAIMLLYGNREGQRAFASVVYSPTMYRYSQHADENTTNQNVSASLSYGFDRVNFNFSDSYTQTTGINTDIAARTTQTSNDARLIGNYPIDDKLGVTSQLEDVQTSYSTGGIGDHITSLDNTVSYQLTGKVSLGPAFNIGVEQPDGGKQQTFEQALLSFNYQPTEKINFSGQGGFEWREVPGFSDQDGNNVSGGTSTSPVFSAGIGYNPFESTKLSVYAAESVQSAATVADETSNSTSVGFSASQRFLQRIFLGFTFYYQHSEYKVASGQTLPANATPADAILFARTGSSQDNYVFRPSVSYNPTAWSSLGVYYQYQDNQSDGAIAGYHDNQIGLSVSAQF